MIWVHICFLPLAGSMAIHCPPSVRQQGLSCIPLPRVQRWVLGSLDNSSEATSRPSLTWNCTDFPNTKRFLKAHGKRMLQKVSIIKIFYIEMSFSFRPAFHKLFEILFYFKMVNGSESVFGYENETASLSLSFI